MAVLLSGTTIGGHVAVHANNISTYALTSVPANVITTSGGQTIAGITYFSNGESLNLYGIRGRFTNEYIHLYNKVGIGHPSGWGQGEGNTPSQGLSTYGGINVSYGSGADSTFNGKVNILGSSMYVTASQLHIGKASSGTAQMSFESWGSYTGAIAMNASGQFHWGGQGASEWYFKTYSTYNGDYSASGNTAARIASDGNIWMSWAGDWLSNLLGAKQNASTAITTSNIGSQSVASASQVSGVAVSAAQAQALKNTLDSPTLPYSCDIYVEGDPNTYYPVHFIWGDQDVWRRIIIKRGYSEEAPWDPIGTGVHHGGLLLDWEGNFGGWGGAEYSDRLRVFNESYTNVCADMYLYTHSMGYVFMLRGGHALYHIFSDQPIRGYHQVGTPDIAYDTNTKFYDHSINEYDVYAPAPVTTINSSRIDGLRTKKQSLFDNRYQQISTAINTGNIGSQSVSYASSAGDANTLDSLDSSEFARGRASYQVLNLDTIKQPGLYQYDGGIGGTQPEGADQANLRTIEIGSGGRYSQMAFDWNSEQAWFRRQTGSTWSAWREFIHSGNIASQSVSYADESGYSASSGSVEWTSVQNKPATFPPSSHNHDDRYLVKGGGWYGVGLPGSRWGGFSVSGGEIVFGDGLPNAGQMGILIDGAYLAGENNGFWSLASDNSWGSRRGMYWDGTYLNFTTNTPPALFSDVRAPIFYDSQDTGYYLDPNGSSNLNGVTANQYYANGWFRNYGNQGIYNESYGTHFYSNAAEGFAITGSGGVVQLQFRSNHQSTLRGYVYADTSNNIGFLNDGGSWALRMSSTRNAEIFGSDLTIGAGGANATNIIMGDNDEGSRTIHCNSNRIGFLNQSSSWGSWCYDDGSWATGVAMYSPIYYDSDDTAFYVDPNSSSRVRNLYVGDSGSNWVDTGGWGTQFHVSNGPHSILKVFARNEGIETGLFSHVGGQSKVGSFSNHDFSVVRNWDNRMTFYSGYTYANGYLQAADSLRAPIFYDSNDTGYYLDPNGTSNLSRVLIPNASSGASLIVGTNNTSRVIDDNARKGLVVNADYYPHIYVNALSSASNDVHGAVISMTGVLSAGGYRRWGMGIANTDPSALSWGWWDNESNPHYSVGGTLGYTNTGSRMWLDTGGNLQTTGSMRAPIFYDSNDTTYYLDPNNTLKSLNIAGNIDLIARSASWAEGIRVRVPSTSTWGGIRFTRDRGNNDGNWAIGFTGIDSTDDLTFWGNNGGTEGMKMRLDQAANLITYGSMRAPIFYDSNDTTYFLDPNADFAMRVYGEICNSNYAEGKMQPGALNIGRTDTNYAWDGGSWAGDVRLGILANTSETWEFGIHDSGDSVMSVVHFDGGSTLTMGRNLGWGQCVVNAPAGYVSNGNAWGTANSAFFPNGITTAGGTNWIYGFTYIGNAPGNGNGHEFNANGTQYSTTSITTPTFIVNNHSDNTRGYRIHNTSGTAVSAMFVNSSNQLVIAAGAVDQVNLNKKVLVNGVALGVNVSPSGTAGRIDASNDIVAYSSSDERLKYNISPIENALDKVKSLTGVEFDWKPEYKHAHGYEGHDTGIIAQQVEAVMPSAVRTNDTGFLAVRYEKLIGLLIEANKELAARVEELEKKLN